MDAHVRERTTALLRRVAFEARRTTKSSEPDAIHDLRVSIRRFTQCLRVFSQFYPAGESKRIRQGLREILKRAGEVRDRDIALELARKAGLPARSPLFATLPEERVRAERALAQALKRWSARDFTPKWRSRLGI